MVPRVVGRWVAVGGGGGGGGWGWVDPLWLMAYRFNIAKHTAFYNQEHTTPTTLQKDKKNPSYW